MKVLLNSIDKASDFVKCAEKMTCDVTVKQGRYIINGKSIMGIFSLDLTSPIIVVLEDATEQETNEFSNNIIKFIVEDLV